MAEVYPSLWSEGYRREGRDSNQHGAYSIAAWMRNADNNGSLPAFFNPDLEPDDRETAAIEGWILGVV